MSRARESVFEFANECRVLLQFSSTFGAESPRDEGIFVGDQIEDTAARRPNLVGPRVACREATRDAIERVRTTHALRRTTSLT